LFLRKEEWPVAKNVLRGLLSRPVTQPFLLKLLKLCHAGLNYGGGQSPAESGEIGALEFVRDTIGSAKPVTLFDVGANDGDYLSRALSVFGDRGNVDSFEAYSFEPDSTSYSRLQARFANDPRIHLTRAALGEKAGTAELYSDGVGGSNASLHRNPMADLSASETVQLSTVDEVCREAEIKHIDLLKIDTEGHEMEVLLGASSMIGTGRIRFVQFEFGDPFIYTRHHFLDLWKLLSPHFNIHRILRHGLVEVTGYSTDLEIYKIANFLCVRKDRKLP
jgi:FkbM family methyltransferase